MLTKLTLKDFKAIKRGDLSFKPLTILLGPNNSGKTSILEVLFLAPNPFRAVPYQTGTTYECAVSVIHLLHQTLDSKGYLFLLNNYTAKSAEIQLHLKDGTVSNLEFLPYDTSSIYVISNRSKRAGRINIAGEEFPFIGRLESFSERYDQIYDSSPFSGETLYMSSNLTKMSYKYLQMNWASIMNRGIGRKVAGESSEISYDRYRDITIEPYMGGSLAINAYFEDGRRIRLGDLGDGIQNYITAKFLFEIVDPEILIWDDIEAHLNPKILLNISEWFSTIVDNGKQVIITTHSLEAAKTIAELNKNNVSILLTFLEDGLLKTRSLSLSELEDFTGAGIDVRVAEKFLL